MPPSEVPVVPQPSLVLLLNCIRPTFTVVHGELGDRGGRDLLHDFEAGLRDRAVVIAS